MITVDFENRGKTGLCDHLYSTIKSQILNGILKADEKLPSKRSLAEHLGISVITVQNAYAQLIDEGYIYSIEKKGFFVTEIKTQQKPSTCENLQIPEEIQEKNDYFANFSSNSTGFEKFPFGLWAHEMREVLNSGNERLLQRSSVNGIFELRNAIAKHLADFRNMQVSPAQIVIGAGTESLYSMVVQLLGRNKSYAVEDPGYHKIASVILLNGASCVPVSIDEEGLNPQALENEEVQVLHLSPAHHFPTGRVMPVRRRMEILSWASKKQDRYIIEDEYDSEFRFNGKPLQTLFSSDKNGKVIYINTFSKTLAPSFRLSFMILPAQLLPVFREKMGFYSCPVSVFEQFTLASFMQKGHYAKHLIRMKNYYRTLRNSLINAIEQSRISNFVTIQEEEAGLHFLLQIKSEKSMEEIQEKLQEEKIKLPLLKDFYYQNPPQKSSFTFIINYSGIKKERIKETVLRLEKALL
ncbi:MAG: PLP-dependent aminotransferase family protein [Treponema sp.]|nr:PLP-dependent aminotransferase family protein [Treponema sp.]